MMEYINLKDPVMWACFGVSFILVVAASILLLYPRKSGQQAKRMSPFELAAAFLPERSSDGKVHQSLPKDFRLLVICNPISGGGLGRKVYDNIVKVMLDRSEVPYEVVFTEHVGHAYDLGADLDIDFDGLANSLGMPNAYLACKRMLDAIHTGQYRPLDLYHAVRESSIAPDDGTETAAEEESRVSEDQGCGVVDLTMTCWGFIADVEMITRRTLGRIPRQVGRVIAALVSILRMDAKAGHLVLYCKEPVPKELSGLGLPQPKTSVTTIRGPIMSITVTNVSHAAGKCGDFIVDPNARCDDGVLSVCVIRSCSRWQAIETLLAMKTGSHLALPWIETYTCSKVYIRNDTGEVTIGGMGESELDPRQASDNSTEGPDGILLTCMGGSAKLMC
ncbi:Sphingosine kinase 2 [Perkinsus olseni]|uniref:Sphingosine kinase 2 n=1 Tax=Perkinsus olseni TaxID=32597 RepID=A0A7J6M156_PEROL|nr:Sphingosine kinase 2 [Perkinsus olseni]